MSSKRVRFGETVHHPISPENDTPSAERRAIYKKPRRNGPAKYYTNDYKEAAARHAHANAARCESRDAAEAVLLLMHKLRRDSPWAWNSTGVSASAEDHVREFLRKMEEPPLPKPGWCAWLSFDTMQRVLIGCGSDDQHDNLYCHEKLHAD